MAYINCHVYKLSSILRKFKFKNQKKLFATEKENKAFFQNGFTPLHITAKKNQMEIALTLLEYGANPNSKTRMDVTPLHLAAQEGHTDMCSLLLAKDATANAAARVISALRCF